MEVKAKEGYENLFNILGEALERAQTSKGRERHAPKNEFFSDQIIFIIERLNVGWQRGQAIKKIVESSVLELKGKKDMVIEELLDAIVYLAAKVLILREEK